MGVRFVPREYLFFGHCGLPAFVCLVHYAFADASSASALSSGMRSRWLAAKLGLADLRHVKITRIDDRGRSQVTEIDGRRDDEKRRRAAHYPAAWRQRVCAGAHVMSTMVGYSERLCHARCTADVTVGDIFPLNCNCYTVQ